MLKRLWKRFWCALDGHGGIGLDNRCKRCGAKDDPGLSQWRDPTVTTEADHPPDEFKVLYCSGCKQPYAMPLHFSGTIRCEDCGPFLSAVPR